MSLGPPLLSTLSRAAGARHLGGRLKLPTLPRLGPFRRRDYEALPDAPRRELICGRFRLSPSPTLLHQFVVLQLTGHLDRIARRHGGAALAAPFDVPLAVHSVVQPDVVYLRREAMDRIAGGGEPVPDLVVEVLSPGTARRDRGVKQALYAIHGIAEYWVVDAADRSIDFLVNREGRFATVPWKRGKGQGERRRYRSPVLHEVFLDLAALWARVEARIPWAAV